ncbi:MAG: PorV/PorQ family protein [Endomicrobium sp.]|jgi:hypothetical protein|nr:PorV/PorQ family protein [Endomicrobium sp.]
MFKRKILLSLIIASLTASAAHAASSGNSVLAFLQLPVGARYIGAGSAGAAIAGDGAAMYWNPSLIGKDGKNYIEFMHSVYLEDMFYDYAAFTYKLSANNAIGVSVQYFHFGNFSYIDDSGNKTDDANLYDVALTLGYAKKILGFGIGASARVIRSKIVNDVNALAFDAAISAPELFDNKLLLAAVVSNAGFEIKYDAQAERLPTEFRFGFGYRIAKSFLLSADAILNADGAYAAAGLEYELRFLQTSALFLRAGYTTIYDAQDLKGFSAGFGLEYNSFLINYAFVPMGDLGNTHRLSLSYFWKTL